MERETYKVILTKEGKDENPEGPKEKVLPGQALILHEDTIYVPKPLFQRRRMY